MVGVNDEFLSMQINLLVLRVFTIPSSSRSCVAYFCSYWLKVQEKKAMGCSPYCGYVP